MEMTLENVSDIVMKYPTKNKKGFTVSEIKSLLKKFSINEKKFNIALGTNTVIIIKGEVVTYHSDVISALRGVLGGNNNDFLYWD